MSENDCKGPGRTTEFKLAAQEKAYLKSGDTGESISSRIEESIGDKINHLPQRFETLFEDVKLLSETEWLEGERWEEGLTKLLDSRNRDLYEKTGRAGVPYEFDLSPRRFGERLGRTVDRLIMYSSDSPIVRIQTELAWGFIEGVCLGETKFWGGGDSTQREAILELVVDNVAEQYERRKKEKEGRAKSMRSYSAESDEANRKIRATLENEGIDPPMWLVLRIQNDIRGFRRMSSDAESSFAEKFTSETVQTAYEEDRLPEKHRVIESFRNDRDHLRSIEWDNLVAASVIEHIPIDEGVSTRSLSEQVDSDNLSTLVKMGTYLAGEDELRGEGRIERPIIDLQREEGELYTEWTWKFTTYGRGLKCYMQLPESILQSPFDDIFSYDAIENASEELTECDQEAY